LKESSGSIPEIGNWLPREQTGPADMCHFRLIMYICTSDFILFLPEPAAII